MSLKSLRKISKSVALASVFIGAMLIAGPAAAVLNNETEANDATAFISPSACKRAENDIQLRKLKRLLTSEQGSADDQAFLEYQSLKQKINPRSGQLK